MVVTKQYAKFGGEKAGRTLYDASAYRYIYSEDGECIEDEQFDSTRTFPNLGLAKKWLMEQVVKLGPEWRGRIYRGCYRNEDFHDERYGLILDAFWEEDDRWSCDVWQQDEGAQFEVNDWR